MPKTSLSQIETFLLFFILLLFNGCTKAQKPEPVAPLPQITTAYLLEHRITSDVPKFQEKSIATLPYEIQAFEESYLLYFVARIPDENRSAAFATTKPRYSLLLQRRAHNWRDFIEVHAVKIAPLQINSHYSAVREGLFYQEYTIDFTQEQLESVQGSQLDLLLINQNSDTSEITLPSHYIKAFLKMLKTRSTP